MALKGIAVILMSHSVRGGHSEKSAEFEALPRRKMLEHLNSNNCW